MVAGLSIRTTSKRGRARQVDEWISCGSAGRTPILRVESRYDCLVLFEELPLVVQTGSVSNWLGGLKVGDPAAAQHLWDALSSAWWCLPGLNSNRRLAKLATKRTLPFPHFINSAGRPGEGRFPRLEDRDDLWKLLVRITENKARDYSRLERRAERSPIKAGTTDCSLRIADASMQAIDLAPSPDFVASFKDLLGHLLHKLPEPKQRAIALLKLEGWTNGEIAEQLSCPLRTVERKLSVVRGLWREELTT